jgi:hypothetical protein
MTTGRINQVTIVHQSAGAQWPNPRRGGLYQEGGCRNNPNRLPRERAGRNRCRRPIHLPPLSSPRRGPQRNPIGVAANNKPTAYTPQEEKAHAASHTRSADRRQDSPQRAGEIVGKAINPQTPNWCPLMEVSRTSGVKRK